MIKAIIFDLNGVFIKSPMLSDRIRDDFGISLDEFLPVLKEVMAETRKPGAPNVYNLFLPYLEKWGIQMTEEEFEQYWFGAEREDTELVNYARELKKRGLKLFVLSNNFKERTGYYQTHFPFLKEIFDKVYFSWQTGLPKPDPRAFTQILDEYQLIANECLYFDDSSKNVEAATALGIQAHQIMDADEIIRIVG